MPELPQPRLIDHLRGKIIYVLVLVILVQTIYPITNSDSVIPLLIYQLLYASLLVAGFVVVREKNYVYPKNIIYARILVILGVVWGIVGVIFTFNQGAVWAQLAGYAVLIAFQVMVTRALLIFIFTARVVNADVLYAAIAVYLLIGAIFVPIYGLIETITFNTTGQHALLEPTVPEGSVFPWQNLIYYSYATLTTLGYGDVLPVTMWARSVSSIEAVIGVLYVAMIMARLVGLYNTEESRQERDRQD